MQFTELVSEATKYNTHTHTSSYMLVTFHTILNICYHNNIKNLFIYFYGGCGHYAVDKTKL